MCLLMSILNQKMCLLIWVHFESERSFTCPCLLFGPRIAAKRKLEPAFSQSTCVIGDNEDNADDGYNDTKGSRKKTDILRSGWP